MTIPAYAIEFSVSIILDDTIAHSKTKKA